MAIRLLERFGSVAGIMNASREALSGALGKEPQVVEALLAARDLSSLGWRESLVGEQVKVTDTQLLQYLLGQLQNPREERLHAIFLDADNRYIRDECMGIGSRNSLSLRIRCLVRRTLELEACRLIIAHNHPSGCFLPSQQDRQATAELEWIARALDVELVDHLIVARGAIYSMRDERQMSV